MVSLHGNASQWKTAVVPLPIWASRFFRKASFARMQRVCVRPCMALMLIVFSVLLGPCFVSSPQRSRVSWNIRRHCNLLFVVCLCLIALLSGT